MINLFKKDKNEMIDIIIKLRNRVADIEGENKKLYDEKVNIIRERDRIETELINLEISSGITTKYPKKIKAKILSLRDNQKKTYPEICSIMGISHTTANRIYNLARYEEKLKEDKQ